MLKIERLLGDNPLSIRLYAFRSLEFDIIVWSRDTPLST
jgi:hypothetical protein